MILICRQNRNEVSNLIPTLIYFWELRRTLHTGLWWSGWKIHSIICRFNSYTKSMGAK